MVLARLRRSSRLIALLLLTSFWGVSHWAGDDACALGVFEAHDESRHGIRAPDGGEPDHCAICHSLRSPRRSFGPAAHLQRPIVQGPVVDTPEIQFRRAPALENLPARAPPATLI
jgi:hypothetical protein